VMAATEAAGPIRGPDPALPIPKVTWKGTVVPGHAASRRSRTRLALVVGAIVLILLLLAASAAYLFTLPPSLTLSSYVVSPGESITVTADHLPPDQLAEIWILSNPYVFPFRADAIGRATRQVVIPFDIDSGDHKLRICWADSCPLSTTLRVNGTVALETPAVSPSTGASPTGSAPAPSPTHSTTTSPSPTPTVTVNSISATTLTSVTFHNFVGSTTVKVCQNGACYAYALNPLTVSSGAPVTFKTPIQIKPTSSLLGIGPAYVMTGCCGRTLSVAVGA
jgi:hypothetical protein